MIDVTNDASGSVSLPFGKQTVVGSTVILGDCVEVMKGFEDNQFDLAIVDPEYGINAALKTSYHANALTNYTKKHWDKKIPDETYFAELFRVSKHQIIWGGNYFIPFLPATRCFLVWDKGEGFYNRTYAECELAWTSFDKNTNKIKFDPLAKGSYKGKIHPTQKPVELYDYCYSFAGLEEGAKVLDTNLGSGSSRISANKAKLNFVGCEIDKEYYDKQEKRYANFISQLRLW